MSSVTLKIKAKSFNMQIINNPCPWGKNPSQNSIMWVLKNPDYFIIKWHLLIQIMDWLEYFKRFYLAESWEKKKEIELFFPDLILSKRAFSVDWNLIIRKLHPSETMFQNITCIFMCFIHSNLCICLFMWSGLRKRWFVFMSISDFSCHILLPLSVH